MTRFDQLLIKPAEFNVIEDINICAELLWVNGAFVEDRIIYGMHQIKIFNAFNFYIEFWISIRDNHFKKVFALESENF